MSVATHIPLTSKRAQSASQILVGTGFLALDLLYRNAAKQTTRRYAGGSFGNVMAILAYLGWKSYPVARIGTDDHGRRLIDDLKEFRVDTKFVRRAAAGATPLIVIRIVESESGEFRSRFEWRHPSSGERLPSYRPLPQFVAREVSPALPKAKVFYFDRAEAASLILATEMRRRGALVFFEPSSCKDVRLFTACMAVSDIVKYSSQRIQEPPHNPDADSPRLEIQTMGEGGLRFRLKQNSNQPGAWQHIPSCPVAHFKDATGCGDWCSAGFLHSAGKKGRASFLRLKDDDIIKGLKFGQALSAVNCQYEGARGPMYVLTRAEFEAKVEALISA